MTAAGGAGLSVTRVESAAGLDGLEREWSALVGAAGAATPFLTWEWLSSWWRHLGAGRRLALVLVRRGPRLVGIGPFAVRRRPLLGWLRAPSLEFLGTGTVGSDYLDLIAAPGEAEAVTRAVAGHLAGHRGIVDLAQLRRGAAAAGLAGALRPRGWTARVSTTDVCPFIELRGRSWDDYLGGLGREHRYAFRRKLRGLERSGLRFEQARSEAERREALEVLIALHRRRWQARGGSQAFDSPQVVAFHDEWSRLALARGWLRLFVLRLAGRPAAALYGLRYREVFYFYQSGFDSSLGKEGVGVVCMGLAIEKAIAEGAQEYDLLHGDEAYKLHWARQRRELERLEMFPPRIAGGLWRAATCLDRSARRTARRLLPERLAARLTAARSERAAAGSHASAAG